MADSPDRKTIERKRKELERKYGEPYVVLRASNGEVAIVSKRYLEETTQFITE